MAKQLEKQFAAFARNVRESFLNAKGDVNAFKKTMDDWLFYLNDSNIEMKKRVEILEKKLAQMEKVQKEERWIRI